MPLAYFYNIFCPCKYFKFLPGFQKTSKATEDALNCLLERLLYFVSKRFFKDFLPSKELFTFCLMSIRLADNLWSLESLLKFFYLLKTSTRSSFPFFLKPLK